MIFRQCVGPEATYYCDRCESAITAVDPGAAAFNGSAFRYARHFRCQDMSRDALGALESRSAGNGGQITLTAGAEGTGSGPEDAWQRNMERVLDVASKRLDEDQGRIETLQRDLEAAHTLITRQYVLIVLLALVSSSTLMISLFALGRTTP